MGTWNVYLRANTNLWNGDGLIWLLPDENPQETKMKPIRFQVQSITLRSRYTEREEEIYAALAAPAIFLYSAAMVKLELEPKEESELDDSEKDEFETMMESGIDETKLFGVEKAYEEGEKFAEKIEGRLPRKQTIMETRIDDTYKFTHDSRIYDNTQFADFDSDLFNVTRVFVGDSDRVKTCLFCIPELDAIADARRRILGTPERPKYYESAVVYGAKNEVQAVITLTDPVGLALAADDNILEGSNGPEPMSYRNLTFKSSGSSLMLPFILSKINFAPNTLRRECRGKVVLYDPDPAVSSEEEGDRHAIIGKVVEGIPSPATTAQGS